MSQLFDPDLLARARDGENVWEWHGDDQVAFQSKCPACRGGFVSTPGIGYEVCGQCGGDGWLVRIEPRHIPTDPNANADEARDWQGEWEQDVADSGDLR